MEECYDIVSLQIVHTDYMMKPNISKYYQTRALMHEFIHRCAPSAWPVIGTTQIQRGLVDQEGPAGGLWGMFDCLAQS